MKSIDRILISLAVASTITACAPAQYDINGSNKSISIPLDVLGGPLTCDPSHAANVMPAVNGITGSVYYLDSAQPRYPLSTDYPLHGHKLQNPIELSQINVPTRDPLVGFPLNSTQMLRDDSSQLMTAWYGFDLSSALKLSPGDDPGDYQLALISDDGSQLSLKDAQGQFQVIVSDEGLHPTQMGCAAVTVPMTSTTRVPMRLTYFQGPLTRLSLVLMWRKISDISAPGALQEVECGQSGDSYFYSWNGTTAVALTPYQNLMARGWKVLNPENFELTVSQNLCTP